MNKIEVREYKQDDFLTLEALLYEAIFQKEGMEPLPYDVIYTPGVYVYVKDFLHKKDDYCLMAVDGSKVAGAVWVRILADGVKGYGNVDAETPEFGIALFKEYRNKGLGTQLMREIINYLRAKGYKQASLSVDKENYACKLYLKVGFNIIEEREKDYLMLLKL